MVALDKYPSGLLALLDAKGVAEERILLLAKADMMRDGTHGDTYIVVTADELILLSGMMILTEKKNVNKTFAAAHTARLEAGFTEMAYECHMLEDLDDFATEELLSSGRLTGSANQLTVTPGFVIQNRAYFFERNFDEIRYYFFFFLSNQV